MRTLKFRIWNKKESEWVILGATGLDCRNGDIIDYYNEAYAIEDQDNYVIEQYTGLKDKNGKEIYEGDILNYTDECTCVVQYEDKGARFIHRDLSDDFPFGFNSFEKYSGKLLEVIGNIHENPELLKEELCA